MNKKPRFRKVLLINLPGVEQVGYRPSPLGILYLASYLQKHSKKTAVDVIDGALEGEEAVIGKIKDSKPDLVGISVLTPSRHKAVEIALRVKKQNPFCRVVLGSVHPTLMWEQMMKHYPVIDYIVKGEGEITLYELVEGRKLKDIEGLVWRRGDGVVNNPDRPLVGDLDKLPFPAWTLIEPMKYPPWGVGVVNGIDLGKEVRVPLIFSRGCMGSCTFCSTWRIWKGYRSRSGKNVADEIEMLVKRYQAKHFVFQDDTLTGSRKEIMSFCREILKRKLKVAFFSSTRVDFVDAEMLKLMKRAGFYKLSYGIESGSPAMLLKINKQTDLAKVLRAIRLTKRAGIQVCALMMFGLPGETEEDRRLSKELLGEIQPDEIGTVGEVWIFPGTALFQQAKSAKLIDDDFWLGKRPYYIYRGGISGDSQKRRLLLRDGYEFCLEGTLAGKILSSLLYFKRKYWNVGFYHLRKNIGSLTTKLYIKV